ncbi:MAG: hypothetical protein JWP56_2513 [Aeromicrobium sp.]|nr:hypothetical protein [Aeromicrobium sp.]
MSIQELACAPPPLSAAPILPRIRDIVARVAVSLTIAVVAPGVLFAATVLVFNVATAMIVALGWMLGAIVCRATTGRGVSGLLVLTGAIMTVKTSITFATGNTFIYFVQPVFVDAAVATIFLASLGSAQPLVARLAPDFCALSTELAARPGICRLFRQLALMWGLFILVKGVITLWLLMTLSTVSFVMVKGRAIMTLTFAAVAATVVWSVAVGRREGLLGQPRVALARASG